MRAVKELYSIIDSADFLTQAALRKWMDDYVLQGSVSEMVPQYELRSSPEDRAEQIDKYVIDNLNTKLGRMLTDKVGSLYIKEDKFEKYYELTAHVISPKKNN